MEPDAYRTPDGTPVPGVTGEEMRAIDRVAVEDVGLDLVRMMEHAGRGLAEAVLELDGGPVTVLSGSGGNGGGGLACARHLANREVPVRVHLTRDPAALEGVTAEQLRVLAAMDVPIVSSGPVEIEGIAVDAVVGYGIEGAPRGRVKDLIEGIGDSRSPTVSLDLPSGVDATTGERPGVAVSPDLTVTLALPKTGLAAVDGDLRLVDLSIPAVVYERVGLEHEPPFGTEFAVRLSSSGRP